ncbi:MAG TPA: hypothetical protein VFT98_03675, partial [Myxococcota bacterium]|nr:hypothetical protein [Myxococcota bacterium]
MFKGKATRSALVLAAMLLLVNPAAAVTFTLDQLVDGSVQSFQSDNGMLTFSDFEITKLKKLSGDLSLYTVTVVADGFELSSSAFTATSGGLKKLNLTYKVTANNGGLINGAEMVMDATRETGRVKVEKDIEDPNSDQGTFLLTLLRNNASLLEDSDTFEGASSFEVEEAIRIKKVSTLHSVRNSYTVVPEPAELSLLMAGLS